MSLKPFGLRALTVVDNTGRRADMCGAMLSIQETTETKEVRASGQLLGAFTQTTGFNFSFEEGSISLEAYAIMTGRELLEVSEGVGTSQILTMGSGDYFPQFTIIGQAIASDGRGDMHLRLVNAVLVGDIAGQMSQDEFYILSGGGIARQAELVTHTSSQAINPSPLPLAPVLSYSAIAEIDTFDTGQAVSSWRDLGNGQHNLNQATNAARPTFTQSTITTLPHISFDGADDNLSTGGVGTGPIINRPLTVIMVASFNSPAGVRYIFDSPGAFFATADTSRIAARFDGGTWQMTIGTQTLSMGAVSVGNDTGTNRVWAFVIGNDNAKRFRNGVLQNTTNYLSLPVPAQQMHGLILATSYIGGGLMDMDVSEILVFSGALSDDTVTTLSTQLMDKWGL
jgi:hypothetical protein